MSHSRLPAIARRHLERVLKGEAGLAAEALVAEDPEAGDSGACFVTLRQAGVLRGCIGSLEARRPLMEDLLDNAVSAATRDPRFPPLQADALGRTEIEISILTPAQPLAFDGPEDLLAKLRPGVDGVILKQGMRRATFLPQVWEQIPQPERFLFELCRKAGLAGDCWRGAVEIWIYAVEKYLENPTDG